MGSRRTIHPTKFNVDEALKSAHGFHSTAVLLNEIYHHELASIGPLVGSHIELQNKAISRAVSATVLQALALELILKVRLAMAQIHVPATHKHAELFAILPEQDRERADQLYRNCLRPFTRAVTIEEALAFSSDVLTVWRYSHEYEIVEASLDEMQCAFNALAHGV